MNEHADSASEKSTRRRSRGRRGDGSFTSRTLLLWLTTVLLGAVVLGTPLACGAVHRPIVLATLATCAVLAAVTAALATSSQVDLKPLRSLALPIVFLAIAAAQLVPVPAALRTLLDPAGSELLRLAGLSGAQPLSLDPPETYAEFAKAAAALCVGAAALVLASGRRLRSACVGLVASAGLVALAIGLGHRAVAEDKVYGLVAPIRGLPVGPFINPNHTAEFLELACFAALAFAFSRSSRDGRRIWMAVSAVLAAGALSALSRGSVLALGSGALTWYLLAPKSDEGVPFRRSRFGTLLIGLAVVVGIAVALGAQDLFGRFAPTTGGDYQKTRVWWDALKVLRVHPAGIGLGAFGHVYPVYQTLPSWTWFEFVENQPLGFLIETGIAGALVILAVLALVLRHFAKNARRDRVEASLAAGLVAVLAHNVVDFGLETLGILLPFCAAMGAMFGRQAPALEHPARRRATIVLPGIAAAAALAGIALLLAPSARDFDALLRAHASPDARAVVRQASLAHPTDYVYALAEARLEPKTLERSSSRLRMLNRAIILCPRCIGPHQEAARDLWRLGRRQQALLEWKIAERINRESLWRGLNELADSGAKPEELATLADDENRYEVSRFLLGRGMIGAAKDVLAAGEPHEDVEFYLVKTQIALASKDLPAARRAIEHAFANAPRDPRAAILAADIEVRDNQRDKAVEILQAGLRAEPTHLELNRKLLALLMQTDRWQAIDRALDGLRTALVANGVGTAEANTAAARIFEQRGQFRRAVSEYQAALAQRPEDLGILLSLARAAEQSGSVSIAIDAYNAALRLVPGQAEARGALDRIQSDKKLMQVLGAEQAHTRAENK